MTVKEDVGMDIKMNIKSFKDIKLLSHGERIQEDQVLSLVDFVNNRYDCADFRLLCLIKTYIDYKKYLSKETVEAIKQCILDFKYWMDEPGDDGMCYWSENHQIIFATCEYLSGQLFPDEVFTNNGYSGKEHKEKAYEKIVRWLNYRFKYGFIEWHSNTYYEEDVAPLSMLVDYAPEEIAKGAEIILDLIMLDFALHNFQGRFVATSGRCYEEQKKDNSKADVNDILENVFNFTEGYEFDYERLSSVFLLRHKYKVPQVIVDIAHSKEPYVIKDSNGLDLKEIKEEFKGNKDIEDVGMFLWAMESFTNEKSINMTIDIFNQWELKENNFLKDINMINKSILRKLNLLPTLIKVLNPATQGVSIQRANTITVKNKDYMLSSVQSYHPGEFGDQQHIWQGTLSRGINIFSTHPGAPMFDDAARNFSPSYWVGNGINPHVVQENNILLCMYKLNGRKGFLERNRQYYCHVHFPIGKMDEYIIRENMLFGRSEEGYAAIISNKPITLKENHDYIIEGKVIHLACIMAREETHGSFSDFVTKVSGYILRGTAKGMELKADKCYALEFKGDFRVENAIINSNFQRYETPFVNAKRNPKALSIKFKDKELHLNLDNLIREEKIQ